MRLFRMVTAAACLVAMVGSGGASAGGRPGPRCHEVDADFTSELEDPTCMNDGDGFVGCVATGVIRHDHLLKGTMEVTIEAAGPVEGAILWVRGTRTLTPHRGGSLTAHVAGVFDVGRQPPAFTELNAIAGGTDRFADASGLLNVFGQATGATTFAGEIRGTVCR
jgi:hypothetical protein